MILISIFVLSIHLQVILWNLGIKISPSIFVPIGMGILFFYIGILCENAKRNWFIGIRTPWTLSSDKVWKKTHKLGAKIFKIYAVVILFGLFFEHCLIWIILTILPLSLYLLIYSYLEWRKIKK